MFILLWTTYLWITYAFFPQALEKFRHAARMVRILLTACRSSRQEAGREEAKFVSFTQYQDELKNSRRALGYGAGLYFDPNQFKACREVQITVLAMFEF